MQKSKLFGLILRLFIGLVLLTMAVSHFYVLFQTISDLRTHQGVDIDFLKSIKVIFYLTYLISPILFILAITGYFWKKMIGWIMLSHLFYFTLFDIFYIKIPSYSDSFIKYLFLLIPISLIIIMHLKALRHIYNVKNHLTIISNLIAILTSLLFVFLSGYLKLHYDMHIFEIIDKIK